VLGGAERIQFRRVKWDGVPRKVAREKKVGGICLGTLRYVQKTKKKRGKISKEGRECQRLNYAKEKAQTRVE